MLRGNLSTRPFYNESVVNGLLLVATVAGLAMAVYSGSRILDLGGQRAKRVATLQTSKTDAQRIRLEADREKQSVNVSTYLLLAGATFEANTLIDERTFSWTTFFGQIEKTIPYDVRLIAVSPRVEHGVIIITMTVNSKQPDDLQKFIDGLTETGSFYDVLGTQVDFIEDSTQNATVVASYVAPSAKAAKPAAGRGGTHRP